MIAAPQGIWAFYKQPDGTFLKEKVVAFGVVGITTSVPIYPALIMGKRGYLINAREPENFSHIDWDLDDKLDV